MRFHLLMSVLLEYALPVLTLASYMYQKPGILSKKSLPLLESLENSLHYHDTIGRDTIVYGYVLFGHSVWKHADFSKKGTNDGNLLLSPNIIEFEIILFFQQAFISYIGLCRVDLSTDIEL